MDIVADPLRVPKAAELLANEFRNKIIRDELKDGEFLLPESALRKQLGVSRVTMREAFRILEAESLIILGRGSRSGARIQRPRAQFASRYVLSVLKTDGTIIDDVIEARRSISYQSALQLAASANLQTAALLAENERLKALIGSPVTADVFRQIAGFDRLITELAGNRTMVTLLLILQSIENSQGHTLHGQANDNAPRLCSRMELDRAIRIVNLVLASDVKGILDLWQNGSAHAYMPQDKPTGYRHYGPHGEVVRLSPT
jgi:DNA-binding FadR family transcriptional regulator